MRRYSTSFSDLFADAQGGFLDIAFHPDHLFNNWIYLSYSAGSRDANRLKVVRFILPKEGSVITQIEHVFTVMTDKNTPVHYGGRLAFLPDGTLLISTGDGFDFREQAQVMSSHLGKILRVSDTGEALESNPFFNTSIKSAM
jgi:glucose/arabinose dehydrogenase